MTFAPALGVPGVDRFSDFDLQPGHPALGSGGTQSHLVILISDGIGVPIDLHVGVTELFNIVHGQLQGGIRTRAQLRRVKIE